MKRIAAIATAALSVASMTGCDVTGTKKADAKVAFATAEVTRGSVVQTVAATGTIEPEELVDIGAQVSGKILYFGKGLDGAELDYCSQVTNGMLLAKIDDVVYQADLSVAEAQLVKAKAMETVANAQLVQASVSAKQAEREWERAQKIGVGPALSRTAYESYESSWELAEAALGISAAQVRQSRAAVVEAEASVDKARRNLSYCEIVSSVDGVIIDRRVNVGQTVVSSMSASSLFLVARDLSRVQIWVAVNEADIGSIKPGGKVRFTVDTFPGRTFEGVVKRIRLNATVSSNVVTYTVEVETDNSDLTLLPYLTANVEFETGRADDALIVPAKALRFRMPSAPDAPDAAASAVFVFAGEGNPPKRVPVEVLLSNGVDAAVRPLGGAELADGARVITGITTTTQAAAASGKNGSPFMPNIPRPPKNRSGGPPH